MNEQDLDSLIEENLRQTFKYLDEVSAEGSVKDNGDTDRIMQLVKQELN